MTARNLAPRVADLPESLRDAISTIRVDFAETPLRATVSVSEYSETDFEQGTCMQRRPDLVWELPAEWDADADTDELARSGLLGGLVIDILRPADDAPRMIIRTHAGSDDERSRWAASLVDEASRGLARLGRIAQEAQRQRDAAYAELKAATLAAIAAGMPEQRAAKLAGVDRMTVRRWQGKR